MSSSTHTGTISFPLRIGVTGHRNLPEGPALIELTQQVRNLITRIREMMPISAITPVRLVGLSPLADGADQLVAREVLSAQPDDAMLEVPLPFDLEDYLDRQSQSATAGFLERFNELYSRAKDVIILDPEANVDDDNKRRDDYKKVGQYVVNRCDVLIAIWNGQAAHGKGGTAEIVQYAQEMQVPLFIIGVSPPYTVQESLGRGLPLKAFQDLDSYNRVHIKPRLFTMQLEKRMRRLLTSARNAQVPDEYARQFGEWMLPYHNRASFVAGRYQTRVFRSSRLVYMAAAAAVFVAAAGVISASALLSNTEVWIPVWLFGLSEVGLMGLALTLTAYERDTCKNRTYIRQRAALEQDCRPDRWVTGLVELQHLLIWVSWIKPSVQRTSPE